MTVKINPKFKELLPALSPEEFSQLEESVLADGVQEPVKLWRNFIIDGHNRHRICEKHNLDYPVKDMFFADEDAVMEWMYVNQLSRRNLTDNAKIESIGNLYALRKKRHGGDRGNQHTAQAEKVASGHNDHLPKNSEVSEFNVVTVTTLNSETPSEILPIRHFDGLAKTDETAAAISAIQAEQNKNLSDIEAIQKEHTGLETLDQMRKESVELLADFQEQTIEYDEGVKPKPPPAEKPMGQNVPLPNKTEKRTSQEIAKQFGVNEKTVRRAETVAKSVEVLPEAVKQDFRAGKISQKAVIEKAREITEPKPAPAPKPPPAAESSTDAFCETAARHGRKIHTLITDLQAAITKANNDFAKHGQNFDDFGDIRRISLNPLKEMEWKTRLLKTLKKCASCKGAKCEKCKQTGYQNKSNYSTTQSAMSGGKS